MSLAVGPYGIEYDPKRRESGSPALRGIVVFVLLAAAISLGVTLVRRASSSSRGPVTDVAGDVQPEPEQPPAPSVEPEPEQPAAPPAPPIRVDPNGNRPVVVRNLLLRLEEAEKKRDVEMAIATIEQLRALPGQPIADKEDELARRLGELNLRWLFDLRNAQWVEQVTAKSGDSASRIAVNHGATLASLKRLNPTLDVDKLRVGAKVWTMNRPRFNLVVHKSSRMAELMLNDKFFKRYDLREAVSGEAGLYETPGKLRPFLAEHGIWFNQPDRAELEVLLPKGSRLLISNI